MIISLANLIVDHAPMTVARRTQDTIRYVQAEWNKSHENPIDTAELHKFLCDEHYGDLTEEQKEFVRLHCDEMRSAYAGMVCRLLLCEEMIRRNMVADFQTYYSVFCPEDQLSKVKRSSEKANMEKEQQKSRRPRPPEGGIELRLIHLVRLVLVVRAD